MKTHTTLFGYLLVGVAAVLMLQRPVWGMGQESFGPAIQQLGRSADWPRGVEEMLCHPSRVYWNWVNGNEHAYYLASPAIVNHLLSLFAHMDLSVHEVVVRYGSPEARSFQGVLTPYNVEFEVASGIYLCHAQQYARTGLYHVVPRLTIHLNGDQLEHLDDLVIPPNVALLDRSHRVQDALAVLDTPDRSLRYRAIEVLRSDGSSSPEALEALKRIAADESDSTRDAAQRAVEQLEQAVEPCEQAMRERLAEFLSSHPQRQQVPDAETLMALLKKADAKYREAFTATGTLVRPSPSGRDQLMAWTVTAGDGCLVIDQRAVTDSNYPPAGGQVDETLYVGPDRMGTIHRSRLWVEGKLIDAKPHASFEPVGSTYDLLIGRILWPLGRGYTSRIDRMTAVTEQPDGMLAVLAESEAGGLMTGWKLTVDPQADFLVRHAEGFRQDEQQPSYIVNSVGTIGHDESCVTHTARWTEGVYARPISFCVTSVCTQPNMDLIRQTEEQLERLGDAQQ